MIRTAVLLSIAALLFGCASAINERNAAAHANAGYSAIHAGDWHAARRQFAQAVVNADLGNLDAGSKGQVNYEYGRALGVTCSYLESEKYLLRSKSFAEQAGRSPYLSLLELGLVSEKQGKSEQAAVYFGQLIPLMEREGLRSGFPLGVVDVYIRYAGALDSIGKTAEAANARKEADAIRTANPTAKPFGTVTPYGSACENVA